MPPLAAESIAVAMPGFRHSTALDGTDIYLAPRPGSAVTTVALVVDAGQLGNPDDEPGMAELAAFMLLQGASGGDGVELAAAFGDLGGEPLISADASTLMVGTQVLSASAASALALIGDVVTYPTLAPHALEKGRHQLYQNWDWTADELAAMASTVEMSGQSSLQARRTLVETTSTDEVRAFLGAAIARAPRAVIVAGAVDDSAHEWILDTVQYMPVLTNPTLAEPRWLPWAERRRVLIVDRPGDDAVLSLSVPAPAFGDPEAEAFRLATAVVVSKLEAALREDEGLIYGVDRHRHGTRSGHVQLLSMRVDPRHLGVVARTTATVLSRLQSTTISSHWVKDVRTHWLVREMGTFQTTAGLADGARFIHAQGLLPDYYQTLADEIASIDGPRVTAVLGRRWNPREVQLVAVGPADRVRPLLEGVMRRETIEVIDPNALL